MRLVLFRGGCVFGGLFVLVGFFYLEGYRLNHSASSAGLIWRIAAAQEPYRTGEFVVFCPDHVFVQQHLVPVWNRDPAQRVWGECPITPFLKRIVGVPSDRVRVDGAGIQVNGQAVVNSRPQPGLVAYSGDFVVDNGEYVVAGETLDSLDSRYFGAIPGHWIEGSARRVFQ